MCTFVTEVVERQAKPAASVQGRCYGERRAELSHVTGVRRTLDVDGFTDGAYRRRRYPDLDRVDLVGRQTVGTQLHGGVDRGVCEVVCGIRLEEYAGYRPLIAQSGADLIAIERAVQPGLEEAEA